MAEITGDTTQSVGSSSPVNDNVAQSPGNSMSSVVEDPAAQSPSTSSPVEASCFHYFPKMAKELQFMVWKAVEHTPRYIPVNNDGAEIYCKKEIPPTPLLLACRDSRRVILRQLTTMKLRYQSRPHQYKTVYVNLDSDIFDFGHSTVRMIMNMASPIQFLPPATSLFGSLRHVSLCFGGSWYQLASLSWFFKARLVERMSGLFPATATGGGCLTIIAMDDYLKPNLESYILALHRRLENEGQLQGEVELAPEERQDINMCTHVKWLGQQVFFVQSYEHSDAARFLQDSVLWVPANYTS